MIVSEKRAEVKFFLKKKFQNACQFKNSSYLCNANDKETNANAKIAQLVEHDLAKVGVAGSSPVFRSKADDECRSSSSSRQNCPDGGIGRRATLRG